MYPINGHWIRPSNLDGQFRKDTFLFFHNGKAR